MDKFSPATCELFGHLVFKGNIEYIFKFTLIQLLFYPNC